MDIFVTEIPMSNLSPQQKQEAQSLFSKALQCARNNDLNGALEYYRKSAAYGHPGAQNNLGNMYKNSCGVNYDPQEAFRLYLEAAQHGNIVAMRNVADCYMRGLEIASNFDTAIAWLMTAAEQKEKLSP